MRLASRASTSGEMFWACTRTSFWPVHSASAPRLESSSSIVLTSRMRGTFDSETGSSVRRHDARIGSAPFLFPDARTRPEIGWPPSMTNDSATGLTTVEDNARTMLAPR